MNIFVSPTDSDSADGSLDNPFQTLGRAQHEVRELLRNQSEPVTVNIRAGEYYMAQPSTLTAEDSGTVGMPVTLQAYNGEAVLLSGGIRLFADKFQRVANTEILSRVLDEDVRESLVQIDLSSYLADIPHPVTSGTPGEIQIGLPTIYIDGDALVSARFPNDVQNDAYLCKKG